MQPRTAVTEPKPETVPCFPLGTVENIPACSRPAAVVTNLTSGLIRAKENRGNKNDYRELTAKGLALPCFVAGADDWTAALSASEQKLVPLGCNLSEVCPR